jgi:hypothetical protein
VGVIVDTSRSDKGVLSTFAKLSCISFLLYYTNSKMFVWGVEEVTILKDIFLLVKSSSSSIDTATLVGFGLLNYR